MEERQFIILKRKLEALSYADPLDTTSAPLVQKLVDDLIHTTESYRTLKQQCAVQAQEIGAFDSKLDGVRQDSVRLQSENSHLHLLLIQQAEKHEKQDKEHYQAVKRLEDRISELSYWKHQATEKLQAADKENHNLRRRCEELLQLTDKLTNGVVDPQTAASKLAVPGPLKPMAVKPPMRNSQATVDVLQAANARILSLQRQLAEKDQELAALQQRAAETEDQIRRRDYEISRLGSRAGADVEVLNLQARNEANESMILQLNSTVDALAAQIKGLEAQVAHGSEVEGALRRCEMAKADVEERLKRAGRDNEAAMRELAGLKRDLELLQANTTRAAAMGTESAETNVLVLRQQLATARADVDHLNALLMASEAERNLAAAKVQELQNDLDTAQFVAAEANAKLQEQQLVASSAGGEAKRIAGQLASREQQLKEVEARLEQVLREIEARQASMLATEQERATYKSRCQELQARCEQLEQGSGEVRTSALEARGQLARAESELRVCRGTIATLEQQVATLRQQLQDVSSGRVRAVSALGSTEEEASRAKQQAEVLGLQLAQEQQAREALTLQHDQLKLELERLQGALAVQREEAGVLEEQLHAARKQLAAHADRLVGAERNLSSLPTLQQRREELEEQVKRGVAALANAEMEITRLRGQLGTASEASTRNERDAQEARRQAEEAREQALRLGTQLRQTQEELEATSRGLRDIQAERDRILADHQLALSDLSSLREQLAHEASTAAEAGTSARTMAQRLAAAGRQAAAAQEERERALAAAEQAAEATAAARAREEEARAQGREWAERARRAEGMVQEYEADMAQLRAARDSDASAVRQLEEALAAARRDCEARRAEVEQLTTLSLRGDATMQECMANLKAMATDLRASDMRLGDLTGELAARDDELARVRNESAELRRLVSSLDGERDTLQGELDHKAEQVAALTSQLDTAAKQLDETSKLLAMAEGRLAHTDARAREGEGEAVGLRQQLATAMDQLRGLSGERDAMMEELRAVSEDLEALVKENQVVGSELSTASSQRDNALEELRRLSGRLASAEQLLRAKEMEAEDVRRAYEALALEHRRLQSGYSALEREGALRETALQAKASEVSSLTEAQRGAQATINQYVMDLQAFERQVDSLSRQLSQGEADAEELVRQREALLEEIRAAQQVRLGLERHREELQRQVASLDSQVAIARARLDDAAAENTSLNQRLALERNRVAELDALLAGMRAREFKSELSSDKSGAQVAIVAERNRILEEQVSTLQHQVSALQAGREAQDRELSRLRGEALALAASTAVLEQRSVQSVAALAGQATNAATAVKDQAAALTRMAADRDAAIAEAERLKTALRAAESATAAATLAASAGDAPGGERVRILELERRNSELLQELRSLQDTCRQQESLLAAAQNELSALQSDHRRLVELVAKLDQEKAQLAAEVSAARQHVAAVNRRAASGSEETGAALAKLQAQLKDEQERRRQAERDFMELMSSIEGDEGSEGGHAPGPVTSVLASRRLQELQAKVEALEAEKAALEDTTAKARNTMTAMQGELNSIQAEYANTSAALQQLMSTTVVSGASAQQAALGQRLHGSSGGFGFVQGSRA